jgi:hypothetical protein
MSIAFSIASLQRNTYSNGKKTSFIVIFSGTRQEMKIKKQNKIVSLCFDVVFFSFVFLLSFCDFFWIPHVRAYVFVHFVREKKEKKKVLCERLRSGK